jgi:hypothetical protein
MNAETENGCNRQQNSTVTQINSNDPSSWPCINSNIRCYLIKHGFEQGKTADFHASTLRGGGNFYLLTVKPTKQSSYFL